MLSTAAIHDPGRLAQELASPEALGKFARAASGDGHKVLHGDGRFDYASAEAGGMPEAPHDGGVYGRVNSLWAPVLSASGGSVTGPLRLAQHPEKPLDAATKGYVDGKLPLTGGSMKGRLVLDGDPVDDYGAATKHYADTKLSMAGGVMTGPLAFASTYSRYEIGNGREAFFVTRNDGEFVLSATPSNFVAAGIARKPGGGMWGDVIDARLVRVVDNYTAGLGAVLNLYPVRYRFLGNDTQRKSKTSAPPYPESPHYAAARSSELFVGLIGQAAESALPDMVHITSGLIDNKPNADILAVNYSSLVMALVNAVRELATANQALVDRVSALEAAR